MTFSDDLTDITSMTDGAYLTLRERNWLTVRTIEMRHEGGLISRRFYASGLEQPWEPDGRQWLAHRLPSLVRRSGFGAAARTRRILQVRGVAGVLDEIRLLESDYARRLYFRELFDAAPMDPLSAGRIATMAGEIIRSDFELRQTLVSVVPLVASDAAAARAYVQAASSISSDFEHRQALDALIDSGMLADGAFEAVAQSAATIGSDFEKRQALSRLLGRTGKPRAPAAIVAALDSAATIGSDFECATLLIGAVEASAIDGQAAAAFFAAVRTIQSDFEQGRVLKTLARRPPLAPDLVTGMLDAVAHMQSDFEQAEVLLSVLKAQPIDAATRPAFIAAADTIHSDFEQGRVFAALVRAEKR
jgi:hypothetical protein